ncbi:MAG: DNA repair protein RecN [Spirochaetaceae bacterium]|jgi:DNA repair protein RecN (Recombination protein N)|nr:DNA repair protein RecN [Spirochaetaceae bacterium]
MLEELSLRNYALVEGFSLSFHEGFNILTGETGAGKSVIVGALGFLLGAKADAQVIRTGADEASVSAVLVVNERNREAREWLAKRGIDLEDQRRLMVRRGIRRTGRGAIYMQNAPVTRADLAEFMGFLFDIHGQHHHESLLKTETHRKYLDHFAGITEEVWVFNRLFWDLAGKKKRLEELSAAERDREARLGFLRYAVEEIAAFAPKSGETESLEAESRKLRNFQKLASQAEASAALLFEKEQSVLGLARKARSFLDAAASIDPNAAPLAKRLESLYYEAEDLSGELRAYCDLLTRDPRRLEDVEERLAGLYRLKKKYGADEEAVAAYRERAEKEIEGIAGADSLREKLKGEIDSLEGELCRGAAGLSAARLKAAADLGARIRGILVKLGMAEGRFAAAVTAAGGGAGKKACGPWGSDDVEFLISANTGEPLKPLARIASGGELSRVMLAIKTVLSQADTLETLVFDEIDTGIGGEVALAIGEYLAKIGKIKQIFCVTHLASIAVRADNHFKVEKKRESGRTVTEIAVVRGEERRREIARLLSGDSGDAALAHADELLARTGKIR